MTKNRKLKNLLSIVLSSVLVAAIALTMTACNQDNKSPETTVTQAVQEVKKLGEGQHKFNFSVKDAEGKETVFEISTDKKTVGEALLDLKIIEGDDGQYGLYVKKVNGITADYDTDKAYWAFYINGEMASSGADLTDIVDGENYAFVYTKG